MAATSLEKTVSPTRPPLLGARVRGPLILACAGVILFHLAWLFQGDETSFWLPGLGLGIALFSWLGWRVLPLLALDMLLVRWQTSYRVEESLVLRHVFADTLLHLLLIFASWWLYHRVARGSRWLDDPRSATLFLILVPGGLAALTAGVQAAYLGHSLDQTLALAALFWLSRMVGILVVAPMLIVAGTPILLRYRLVDFELPPAFFGEREGLSRTGDRIELGGLTFATTVLAALLLWTHVPGVGANWLLWSLCLILIVWTCIRQGLAGACFCASVTSIVVLIMAQTIGMTDELRRAIQSAVQGNLLAFCSAALLVGVSASWIRANETRFRHVVSRIPFVVYSARLPYGIPTSVSMEPGQPRRDGKVDLHGRSAHRASHRQACQRHARQPRVEGGARL
jgi:hypothetical protein